MRAEKAVFAAGWLFSVWAAYRAVQYAMREPPRPHPARDVAREHIAEMRRIAKNVERLNRQIHRRW